VCVKFREPYKFEKNDKEEEDASPMKTSEIEKDVSLDENAPIEEEKEIDNTNSMRAF